MASTIRIAILADAAKAKAEMASVAGSAEGISKKFSSLRAPAAAALLGIGAGAVKAVQGASDLNETVNKSNTIFGASAGTINSWSNTAATSLGLSKSQALEAASGFGNMFTQLGFTSSAAADLSKNTVQMAADLGSFNNLPTADVTDRISAAMRGEYDSLQTLIPNINAARVEQEALAATGKSSAKDLTAAEKATATLAIVQKDGAAAAGDFAKTSTGAANSQKIAAASAADLTASLGQALLPAYTAILQAAGQFVGFLNQHQQAVTIVVGVIAALAAGILVLSAATTIYNGVLTVIKVATVAYTAVQWLLNAAMTANPIGIIVVAIGLLIAGLVLAYRHSETFRNVVQGALKAVGAVVMAVFNTMKAIVLAVWGFITGYIKLQITVITAVIKAIVAVATTVWNAIKTAAGAVWKAITSTFTTAVNAIKSGFSKVREFASDILSRVKSLFSPSALVAAGRKLIEGLVSGIRDRIGAAVDAVKAGLQKIKNLLPGSPIKDGPLKSWNNGGAGKRLMGFLASGISAGAPQVRTSLANALDPAVSLGNRAFSAVAGGGGGSAGGGGGLTVNFNGLVTDPVAAGREVAKALASYKSSGGRL